METRNKFYKGIEIYRWIFVFGLILLLMVVFYIIMGNWPIKEIKIIGAEGLYGKEEYNYEMPIVVEWLWYISIIIVIFSSIGVLGKNFFHWFINTLKKYLLGFFSIIIEAMAISIFLLITFNNVNWKNHFYWLVVVSTFLLFLVSKYLEEEQGKIVSDIEELVSRIIPKFRLKIYEWKRKFLIKI